MRSDGYRYFGVLFDKPAHSSVAHYDVAALDVSNDPVAGTQVGVPVLSTGAFDSSDPAIVNAAGIPFETGPFVPQVVVQQTGHARPAGSELTAASTDGSGESDPSGQLWYGLYDIANSGLDHIDTDDAGHAVSDVPLTSGGSNVDIGSVGLDGANGLYFIFGRDGLLRDGHIENDIETGHTSEISSVNMVFGTGPNADIVNALAVDPINHIVYVAHWGQTDALTGIFEVQYTASGTLTSPFNASSDTITDSSHVLFHDDNTGKVNGTTSFTDVTAMQYDMQNNSLYYVDESGTWAGSTTSGSAWASQNGIYVVSTTTANPTPTKLTTSQFGPETDNHAYIVGLALNEAQGLIYFAVNNASAHSSTFWYMPIAGGTATQMTAPVSFGFVDADAFGGVNPIVFDPVQRQLYISDQTNHSIAQFTLSSDGHTFTSGNDSFQTTNPGNDGGIGTSLYFDPAPTLSTLSATTTEALQGGSALTLLTGTPTITDPQDGSAASNKLHMGYAQVVVANAQSGDNLFINGQQSGTVDSGKITVSWNASTHTLTFTGDETESEYASLMTLVSYQDTGTDNSVGSHPTRTLDWIISDGTTTANHTSSDPNFETTTLIIDRSPTLSSDSYAVLEGGSATGTGGTGGTGVLGNDVDRDGDAISVSQVNGSAVNVGNSVAGTYGHLTLNGNGSFGYAADRTSNIDNAATGSHPIDTFTYQVTDGLGGLTTTTVSFTIDRAPTVVADSGTAVESASGTGNVLANDSDQDGDSLTVSQVNGSAGGVGNSVAGTYGHITIGSNGGYTYTADNTAAIDGAASGAHLTDTFTYQASDGHGGTTSGTVTVTLDRAPTAANDSGAVVESGTLTVLAAGGVLANDSDRDGDSLTVSAIAGGTVGSSKTTSYGHVTLNGDGSYSYAADNGAAIDGAASGAHLTDTVSFTVNDGHGGTANESLTLTLDRAPTVATLGQTVFAGASFDGTAGTGGTGALAGDSDRDGDSLTITALTGGSGLPSDAGGAAKTGSHGTLSLHADGSYSYVADAGAPDGATDSFTYTVSDGQGGTSQQTLTFTLDRAPNATGSAATTATTADFTAAHQVSIHLSLDKAVTVTGTPTLSLSDASTATYDAAHSTATDLAFTQTVTGAPPTPGNLPTVTGYAGSIADAAHNPLDLGSGVTLSTYTVEVSDTAANVAANFDSLAAVVADISDVHLSDGGTPNLDLSVSQALNDGALIALIEPAFDLVVNDSAAHVQAAIDSLQGESAIHAITLSDAGTPTITVTETQATDDAAIIARIQSPFDLMVTGASGTTPVPDLVTAEHYTAFEQFYDAGNTLTKTVYTNSDGTQSTVFDTTSVSIDDHAGSTGQIYDLGSTTSAAVTGGSATDAFYFAGNFNPATDTLDGGGGVNQLALDGDYSGANALTLGSGTLANIQSIALLGAHSYDLTTVDANVPSGQTLVVWALDADSLVFDGAAETNGNIRVIGTAGADTITGGDGNDIFYAMGGADSLTGGPGNDIFVYTAVTDSTGTNGSVTYDTVTDFNAAADRFDFPVPVSAIAPTIAAGALTLANFNTDLATAVNASALPAHDAVLFTPTTGDAQFSGHTFLIVDANGAAGYQAGADYVIDLTGLTGTLSHGDFI